MNIVIRENWPAPLPLQFEMLVRLHALIAKFLHHKKVIKPAKLNNRPCRCQESIYGCNYRKTPSGADCFFSNWVTIFSHTRASLRAKRAISPISIKQLNSVQHRSEDSLLKWLGDFQPKWTAYKCKNKFIPMEQNFSSISDTDHLDHLTKGYMTLKIRKPIERKMCTRPAQ